jgi:hypothetical protein
MRSVWLTGFESTGELAERIADQSMDNRWRAIVSHAKTPRSLREESAIRGALADVLCLDCDGNQMLRAGIHFPN